MNYFQKKWKEKYPDKAPIGLVKINSTGGALVLDNKAIVAWNGCGNIFNITFAEALNPCWDIACVVLETNSEDISVLKNKSNEISIEDAPHLNKIKSFMLTIYAMTVDVIHCKGECLYDDKMKVIWTQINALPLPFCPAKASLKPTERKRKDPSSVPEFKLDSKVRLLPEPKGSFISDSKPKPSAPKKMSESKVVKLKTVVPAKSTQPGSDSGVVEVSPIGTIQRIIQHLSEVIDSAKIGEPRVVPEKRKDLKSSVSRTTDSPFRSTGTSVSTSQRVIRSSSPEIQAVKSELRPVDSNLDLLRVDAQQVIVALQSIVEHLAKSVDTVVQGSPIGEIASPVASSLSQGSSTGASGKPRAVNSGETLPPPPPPTPLPSADTKVKPAGARKKPSIAPNSAPQCRDFLKEIQKGKILRKVKDQKPRDNSQAILAHINGLKERETKGEKLNKEEESLLRLEEFVSKKVQGENLSQAETNSVNLAELLFQSLKGISLDVCQQLVIQISSRRSVAGDDEEFDDDDLEDWIDE